MEKDLQKRIEEAAKKYAKIVVPECISSYEDFFNNTTADFRNGAKYGYKEAIAEAKKWLKVEINGCEFTYGSSEVNAFLAEFETGMNKLWEESK